MKVLKTFTLQLPINLKGTELREAQSLLNLHYLGDVECNEWRDGKFVAKYPELENKTPELQESHYTINRGCIINIEVELLENGYLKLKK
jgi:hypothetical protein